MSIYNNFETKELLTCKCGDLSHSAIIHLAKYRHDVELSLYSSLSETGGFFNRLFIVFKYLFRVNNEPYFWTLLDEESVSKIRNIIILYDEFKLKTKGD